MMGKDGAENNVQLGTELCPHVDSGSPKLKKCSIFFSFSPGFPMILPVLDKKDKAQQI